MGRDWEPIETAPRDGTVILAYIRSEGDNPPIMQTVSYARNYWWDMNDCGFDDAVTHWMALPPAPDASD
jgi:hypothetical protein